MRRVLLLVVLTGWLAAQPVRAQDAQRPARSVETVRQANKAHALSPDAARRDPAQSAAKPPRDLRPLRGLDNSRIPRYPSIEAFLATHSPAPLRAQATVVAKAEWVRRSVPMRQAHSARRAATTMPGLSVKRGPRVERALNGTVRWMQGRLGRAAIPQIGRAHV